MRLQSTRRPAGGLLACAAAAACATTPSLVLAQTQTAGVEPQRIEIKGQGLRDASAAYSTTVIDAQQVRDAAVTQPEQLLRQVPGVEVRNYNLGGVVNVIAIRGFNGGAHGGDLGMLIDGVPLNEAMSHSDGYADLNVIVPLEISRFEVFRGPVSALYGNFNRGGLIAVESRRGGRYAQADVSLGSFETVDVQGALGAGLGAGDFNGALQVFRTGDFRPDSKFTRTTLSGRWTLPLSAGSSLALSARWHKGDWDSASYLLKSQFDAGDPYGKDPRVRQDGGSKNFGSLRADYNTALGGEIKLLTFAYATQQDYTRFFTRPLNASTWSQREETYDRSVAGLGFSLNGTHKPGGIELVWVAGAEAYRESTDYLFFEGLQARTRTAAAVYDRTYDFDSRSVFGEVVATVAPWFKPTLGIRHDRFSGECVRRTETGTDPCARLNDASRTTPKIGFVSSLMPGLDLRASRAEGFALPPGVAKYAPGGAALEPTVLVQTEVGAAYRVKWLRADLTSYRITSSNEVRTVSPGAYENFGRTRRKGVEAALTVLPMADVELSAVATRTRTAVLENANAALVGKQLTGVPASGLTLSAALRPSSGWGGSVEWRRVNASAVDAPNALFYGAFRTFDVGVHYQGEGSLFGGSAGGSSAAAARWRVYARIDNATDRVYASNAFLIGGQQLVAPAAPRSIKLGLQADF